MHAQRALTRQPWWVRLLADAAARLKIPARIEPYHLSEDDDSRPDIQLDLPEYSLVADVTISHPNAGQWRAVAADRGVEAVGAARSAEKDAHYGPMAQALGVRFTPFVLYTYGSFHKSALSTIEQLGAGYDPAVALVSLTAWKLQQDLKDRIAVSVQRHTANIVIDDDRQARAAGVSMQRRRPGRRAGSAAVRRPRPVELPPRRREAERQQHVVSRRAASLCPALLISVPAAHTAGAVEPLPAPASPVEASTFVPGTPGMDVGPEHDNQAGVEAEDRVVRAMSVMCIDACVCMDESEPAAVVGGGAVHVNASNGVAGAISV